jgi:hypothetical protein
MAEERTEGVAEKPKVTPAEARLAKVMGALGTAEGWQFVEYVEGELRCEATGLRMKKGVKLVNPGTNKTVVIGKGVAKKYTDVEFPKRQAKPKDESPE